MMCSSEAVTEGMTVTGRALNVAFAATFAVFALSPTMSYAIDWNGCADDLDGLRRAARDANEAATEVKSQADDYDDCRRFPDIHDLLHDGCQSDRSEYQSAISNLGSELDTVQRRVRSVASSCSTNVVMTPPVPSSDNRMCDLYRSYKASLPIAALMKICKENMPEAECLTCLGK